MGFEDGHLPQKQSLSPQVYDEERRIAYVGITRAKNFLFLTVLASQREKEIERSPFLEEMFGPATASREKEKKKASPQQRHEAAHENPIFERIRNLQRKAADPVCSESEADAATAMARETYGLNITSALETANYLACLLLRQTLHLMHLEPGTNSTKRFWQKESEAWRKAAGRHTKKVVENNKKSAKLADGLGGDGSGWTDGSGAQVFTRSWLYDKKRWPSETKRQKIFTRCFAWQY